MNKANHIFTNIAPKIGVDLLWILAIIFAVIGVLYVVITFYAKSNITLGLKYKKVKKRELGPIVSEFLFFDETTASLEDKNNYVRLKIKIRQMLKNKRNRTVFSEVLVELSQDLSGETLKSLHNLYKNLGLDKDALQKLKSWRWHTISQGIVELTQMKVTDSYKQITKFVNGSRGVIRKQSVIAIVSLKDEGINYFLDTTQHKISEWQQLKLLEILQNKKNYNPPRFKNWLFSKNTDTVLFALRLIKYYDQSDANNSIVQLIRHKNSQIRQVAIQCVSEFNLVEARESLKKVFNSSTNDSKLLIIEALENLGFKEDVQFLNTIEDSKEVFAVKNKALVAINSLLPENHLELDGLEDVTVLPLPTNKTKNINPLDVTITPRTEVEKDLVSAIDHLADNTEDVPVIDDINEEEELVAFSLEDTIEIVTQIAPIDDDKHIEFVQFLEAKRENSKEEVENTVYVNLNDKKSLNEETLVSKELSIQSVFKSLYDVCDTEAKLILLDEIGALGDQKELNFILTLLNAPEQEIRAKAETIKNIIESRLKQIAIEDAKEENIKLEHKSTIKNIIANQDSLTNIFVEKSNTINLELPKQKELKSLEFCFLQNEDEKDTEFSYLDIDFLLSEEFYKDNSN